MVKLPVTPPYLFRENSQHEQAIARMRRCVHDALLVIALLALVLMSGMPLRARASVMAPNPDQGEAAMERAASKLVTYAFGPQTAARLGLN